MVDPDNINGVRYVYVLEHYKKYEYYIPMRDGVKLYTQVYSPRDTSQKYPILLQRTPYSVGKYGPTNYRNRLGPNDMYPREGFIFVHQDVRGKFKSEGEFVVIIAQKNWDNSGKDHDSES